MCRRHFPAFPRTALPWCWSGPTPEALSASCIPRKARQTSDMRRGRSRLSFFSTPQPAVDSDARPTLFSGSAEPFRLTRHQRYRQSRAKSVHVLIEHPALARRPTASPDESTTWGCSTLFGFAGMSKPSLSPNGKSLLFTTDGEGVRVHTVHIGNQDVRMCSTRPGIGICNELTVRRKLQPASAIGKSRRKPALKMEPQRARFMRLFYTGALLC